MWEVLSWFEMKSFIQIPVVELATVLLGEIPVMRRKLVYNYILINWMFITNNFMQYKFNLYNTLHSSILASVMQQTVHLVVERRS